MYDRLEEFARTLPEPRLGSSWDAYCRQHVRNAERMRAEAFRCAALDLVRGLRAARSRLATQLAAARRRFHARPADAWPGGGD